MIAYPAIIEFDKKDKAYNVSFPDLPGCFTFGETLEGAKAMAEEALTLYLESIDSRRLSIPNISDLKGSDIYYIQPEKPVAFAIWLKKQREALGLSQSDVAKKLGIKYQTYQRIENPSKTNPTLKTILKLEEVFNKSFVKI